MKPKITFDFDMVGLPEGVEADEWKFEYCNPKMGAWMWFLDRWVVAAFNYDCGKTLVATPIVHAKKKMAWATVTRDYSEEVDAWFDVTVLVDGYGWCNSCCCNFLGYKGPLPEPGGYLRHQFEVDDVAEGPKR